MEDVSFLLEFLDSEVVIIAVFLYILGMWVKSVVTELYTHYIPFMLWFIGSIMVLICTLYTGGSGFNGYVLIQAIIQGAIASALAVNGSQMVIQLKKAKEFNGKF